MTLNMDFQRIFPMTNDVYIGLTGLGSDVLTMSQKLKYKVNMYKLSEEREIKPRAFAHLVSSTLYEKR